MTLPNDNINSMNDLFKQLIIRRNKPISEGGGGGKGNMTILSNFILSTVQRHFADLIHQLEQRFDDLSWINLQQELVFANSYQALLDGRAAALIASGSLYRQQSSKLKPIAVNTDFPTPLVPDCPTFLSQGNNNLHFNSSFLIFSVLIHYYVY